MDLPEADPMDDAALLELVNQGEADVFDRLYHRHRDWVVRRPFRFTGDEALDYGLLSAYTAFVTEGHGGTTVPASVPVPDGAKTRPRRQDSDTTAGSCSN